MQNLCKTSLLPILPSHSLNRVGLMKLHRNPTPVYCLHHTPKHGTLYASLVELSLCLFCTFWHYRWIDMAHVCICPYWRTGASTTVPCSCLTSSHHPYSFVETLSEERQKYTLGITQILGSTIKNKQITFQPLKCTYAEH